MRGYSQTQWTVLGLALATTPLAAIDARNPVVILLSLVLVIWVCGLFVAAARTSPFARSLRLFVVSMVLLTAADIANGPRSHITAQWDSQSISHNVLTNLAWILMFIAMWLIRRSLPVNRSSSQLDPWIVITTLLLISLGEVIYPVLSEVAPWDLKLNALTVAALHAIVFIEVLRIWLVSGVVISRALSWLIAGLLIFQIAEAWALIGSLKVGLTNDAVNYLAPQTMLSLSALGALGVAALDNSIHQRPIPAPSNGLDATRARIFLLTIIVLAVAPTLLALDHELHATPFRLVTYLGITFIIIALVASRIFAVIAAYRASLEREHILADITDALVRTTSVEEIQQNLNGWVSRLTGIRDLHVDARPVLWNDPPPKKSAMQLHDGLWRTELTIPGQELMALDVVWSKPLADDKLSLLRIFARSLGVTLDRISYSSQLSERQTTQRLESLLANSADVVMVVSTFGQVTYTSPAVERLLERSPASVVGQRWTDLVAQTDAARAVQVLDRSRNGVNDQLELRFVTGTNLTRFVDCTVTWIDADDVFIITHHDVTERHYLQAQLIDQAFHDPLTGLANRALFRDRVGQALAHARRTGSAFVVILMDLDDFKVVNDSLGHPAGDQLLCRIAERLADCLRSGDTAARLGGDEFAVVLENARNIDEAIIVAQRILEAMRAPIDILGHNLTPSVSLGIALGTSDSSDSENLERNADLALYQAKNEGKDRYAIFEPEMHGEAVRRLQTITELRGAVEQGHVSPWFQPIMALGSGAICGVEALARWHHPTAGVLEPKEFIGLAEDTGIIVALGRHMLRTSLEHAAQWQKDFPEHSDLRVTVNLSVRQVFHESIVSDVALALRESGIDPQTVVLEITESVFMPGERTASTRVRELSDLGVQIYIDDFGTGYSSLRYLRELPVNGIKMAREFVEQLPDSKELGFARAIRDLAGTLGLDDIIAEGIETQAQRNALHDLGYHLGQGYLLGKAVSAPQVSQLLATTPSERWSLRQIPGPSTPSLLS